MPKILESERESCNSETFESCEFETDLLLLGIAALEYAARSPGCPQRHWGSRLRERVLTLGNHRYRIGSRKYLGEQCLYIRKDLEHFRGGAGWQDIYIPLSELNKVAFRVRAAVVNG